VRLGSREPMPSPTSTTSRAWRSRLLKARLAWLLRKAGWQELYTWNLEGNVPILAANARLGFVQLRGIQALTLDFGSTLQ
jgi:hypothetical protein